MEGIDGQIEEFLVDPTKQFQQVTQDNKENQKGFQIVDFIISLHRFHFPIEMWLSSAPAHGQAEDQAQSATDDVGKLRDVVSGKDGIINLLAPDTWPPQRRRSAVFCPLR